MKQVLIVIALLAAQIAGAQQHATVVNDTEHFTMHSVASGTLNVTRTITVFDEHGLAEAVFSVYTNQFETLSAFKGVQTLPGGKTIKIKKSDLQTVSIGTGLAEDGFLTTYLPSGSYPFTISYEYTVQYRKGFAVFPVFAPVRTEKTRLEHGSYTLSFPEGTKIRYHANVFGKPRITDTEYNWAIDNFAGYTEEHLMPEIRTILPYVQAAPVDFMYDGVPGRQGTWQQLGQWQYGLLQGADDLPAERVAEMKALTASCKTTMEKVRLVYDYLCNKTRYVSIQFGIGGFRPFPASRVDKTGFGDCKALSNYFISLLRAVGVESVYTVLNTRRPHMDPDYCSLGQSDHVMVSVPLRETGDTLLVECTRRLPLGYRPRHAAGHDLLRIHPSGGELAGASGYPDSLSRIEIQVTVQPAEDGSAHIEITDLYSLDKIEPLLDFQNWPDGQQRRQLTSGLDIHPQAFHVKSIEDNFDTCDGIPDWYPFMRISYAMECRGFCRVSGNRLFVPVNLFAKKLFIQRTERINPLENDSGSCYHDILTYQLPEGYSVESVPDPVQMDEEWGTFTSTVTNGDGVITVDQFLHLKRFQEDPSSYAAYRTFARALNKAYEASIVLVRP